VPISSTIEFPRRSPATERVKKRNGDQSRARDERETGDVYYSRGDGVKRDVIVNIFAASALSLKTMAVVQLSRFKPTSALG